MKKVLFISLLSLSVLGFAGCADKNTGTSSSKCGSGKCGGDKSSKCGGDKKAESKCGSSSKCGSK